MAEVNQVMSIRWNRGGLKFASENRQRDRDIVMAAVR